MTPAPGPCPGTAGRGLVAALREEAEAAAGLLAGLTSRRSACFRGVAELMGGERPEVLVTPWDGLTAAVLEWLYSGPRGPAPGIICGDGAAELRHRATLAAQAGPPPQGARWAYLDFTRPFGGRMAGEVEVMGADASGQQVRAALGAGAGVLALGSHGDGLDVSLGTGLALCSADGSARGGLERAPSCRVRGVCHRYERPIEHVVGSPWVVQPGEVSARVALLDVCYGTLPGDSRIDPRWSLAAGLVGDGGIACLVTTWGLILSEPGKLAELLLDLRRGATVGAAVGRFNRSAVARRTATRLCVFGDPATRAAPGPDRTGRRTTPARAAAPAWPAQELRELAFSRACLTTFIETADEDLARQGDAFPADRRGMRASAAAALDCLLRTERLSWMPGIHPRVAGQARTELREVLLRDVARRGPPSNDWLRLAHGLRWRTGACPGCGDPARIGTGALRVSGASKRRIGFCSRCGLACDMPVGRNIALRFDAAQCTASLHGEVPAEDWAAGLVIVGRLGDEDRLIHWPAEADGSPVRHMSLGGVLRPVPLTLAFVLVHEGTVSWAAQDIHGGQVATAERFGAGG